MSQRVIWFGDRAECKVVALRSDPQAEQALFETLATAIPRRFTRSS